MGVRSHSAMFGLCLVFAGFSLHCSAKGDLGLETEGALDSGPGHDAIVPGDVAKPSPDTAIEDLGGLTLDSEPDTTPPPPTGCRIATLGEPGVHPSDLFDNWLDKSGAKSVAALKDQVLTATLLNPYKMLVVRDVKAGHAYSAAEVTVLKKWVDAGGGLLTLSGFGGTDENHNVNLLLAPYGINYGDTLVLYGGGTTVPITTWAKHPVTKGITRIGFDNGYEALGTATTIGSESGFSVFKAKSFGSGHVLAWGDEWIMFDTEWSTHPDYQVKLLWQNIVDWFNPGAGCSVPDPPK
jgi:hypothetical protein